MVRQQVFGDLYSAGQTEPYCLLSRHPLLRGLMQFTLTLRLRDTGLSTIPWRSILYVALLYHALRMTSVLADPWPEMDTFIAVCTPEKLFIGGLPTTLEDCFKRFCLMAGVAPESFARNRRPKHGHAAEVTRTKNPPRNWSSISPIMKIFHKQLLLQESNESTLYNVKSLVNNDDASSEVATPSSSTSGYHLLTSLKTALAAEQPQVIYDYLSMHF